MIVSSSSNSSSFLRDDSRPTDNSTIKVAESSSYSKHLSPSSPSASNIVASFLPPLATPSSDQKPKIPSTANPFLVHHVTQDYSRYPKTRQRELSDLISSVQNQCVITSDSAPKIRSSVDASPTNSTIATNRSQPTSKDLARDSFSVGTPTRPPSPPSSLSENLPSQIAESLPGSSSAIIGSDFSGKPLQRNVKRLEQARKADSNLLGESNIADDTEFRSPSSALCYLPNEISKIFPSRLAPPPLQPISHPIRLSVMLFIADHKPSTPKPSPFRHSIDDSVVLSNATFNSQLIERFDFDMQRVIDSHPDSVITPGSEFRTAQILEPLLAGHPYWSRFHHNITHGVSYPLTAEEDEPARRAENQAILEYGNHASGKKNPEALSKVLRKDASKGFSLPITFDCAKRIKHSRISPMGVAHQLGIDANGDLVPKDRLTHDQSFSLGFCPSTNDLINQSKLIDLVMGHCLDRVLHQIVALRWKFPTDRILISKFDWSSAYRRVHGNGDVAARNITIDPSNSFAHLNLRLTFGASANPAEFSIVSEIGTDFCNDLADFDEWQPEHCQSPLQEGIGGPKYLPEEVPIVAACELAVSVPPRPHGFHDSYLDDMIQVFLATNPHLGRCPSIVPLVVHLMTRPVAKDEPITRKDMLEADKLEAEGAPTEEQRVLGWIVDTRRLLLRLPQDKLICWTREVQHLLKTRRTTFHNLRSLIGKLLHATKGIPHASFWLSRLREYQTFIERAFRQKQKAKPPETNNNPKRPRPNRDVPPAFYRYSIPDSIAKDLEMWPSLLQHAHNGISLNRLVCRVPTHLFHADSCPEGMGGYSVRSGRAWRFRIDQARLQALAQLDPSSTNTRTNNLFEYIAIVVSMWVDCWFDGIEENSAVLSLSDNSSAVGWMYKSSFGSDKPLHVQVSKKLTELILLHKFSLQAEHIPGSKNDVSDILSRHWHLNDNELTLFLHENFMSQIPENFHINPLPNEILCWISSIVPACPESSSARPKEHTKSATNVGNDGQNISTGLDSVTTHSSSPSEQPTTEPASHVPSYKPSAMPNTPRIATARNLFEQALLAKPLETWHRASGIMTGQAPATVKTAITSTPSSLPSNARGQIWIPPRNEKKLLLPNISAFSGSTVVETPDSPTHHESTTSPHSRPSLPTLPAVGSSLDAEAVNSRPYPTEARPSS